jgi:hypothetical protein
MHEAMARPVGGIDTLPAALATALLGSQTV